MRCALIILMCGCAPRSSGASGQIVGPVDGDAVPVFTSAAFVSIDPDDDKKDVSLHVEAYTFPNACSFMTELWQASTPEEIVDVYQAASPGEHWRLQTSALTSELPTDIFGAGRMWQQFDLAETPLLVELSHRPEPPRVEDGAVVFSDEEALPATSGSLTINMVEGETMKIDGFVDFGGNTVHVSISAPSCEAAALLGDACGGVCMPP